MIGYEDLMGSMFVMLVMILSKEIVTIVFLFLRYRYHASLIWLAAEPLLKVFP